jgi:hypothetical protein
MYILHTTVLQCCSAADSVSYCCCDYLTATVTVTQPQRLPIHHLPDHYQQWGSVLELRTWLHGELLWHGWLVLHA